ncbi:hypothetical protein JDV02_006747 [Purpureocillium takamizusanense]|uniref:Peptide N-acetyl-beta-D-glucosaminyl asparaginase amidase A N-terminal domain-containing protein n=1 Tax=Purpureocillium takamizusanense TaxID=2060973 RepID=A0A9Q8QJ64_9HYPO|nr:uncharacterized protein JDV02_006747 [Purpureocillium takamizusanense]UNI20680.1 hypothetical protein JDV02_006747 [Purpureocillium takamizusanense]
MVRMWWLIVVTAHAAIASQGPARFDEALRGIASGQIGLTARESAYTNTTAKALRCLQVTSPVLTPDGLIINDEIVDNPPEGYKPKFRIVTLMEHSFGNSYGHPYVGKYEPPDVEFDEVVLNLTVVSEGRQYDRLALMYLGDVEVWRTSTAEPKPAPGIVWTYWKDMTHYLPLWKKPQTLIFDLGNLLNDKYTGSFNVTLTATFIEQSIKPRAAPADLILPISARRGECRAGSAFTYPDEKAESQIALPFNIQRAVVSIAANGQADEEFWWSNVPDEGAHTFPNAPLPGLSSFREVRLRIDNHLAGLSWPMPVIFTGGISPPLHRPIVGLEAFDLREQEIDITPWAGLLCDGRPHNFSLEVVGQDEQVVPRYWVLSAKIFVWYSANNTVTEGSKPRVRLTKPNYVPRADAKEGEQLVYNQTASRTLSINSHIKRNGDDVSDVSWTQKYSMGNAGLVTRQGDGQMVWALYQGEDRAEEDRRTYYNSAWKYPLQVSYLALADKCFSLMLDANLTQGEQRVISGKAVFPTGLEAWLWKLKRDPGLGVQTNTQRSGRGFFFQRAGSNKSGGFGNMNQSYELGGRDYWSDEPVHEPGPVLYRREIYVANETTVYDEQYIWNAPKPKTASVARIRKASPGMIFDFPPVMSKGHGAGSKLFHKDEDGSIDAAGAASRIESCEPAGHVVRRHA